VISLGVRVRVVEKYSVPPPRGRAAAGAWSPCPMIVRSRHAST
jgi:hypothetical protein